MVSEGHSWIFMGKSTEKVLLVWSYFPPFNRANQELEYVPNRSNVKAEQRVRRGATNMLFLLFVLPYHPIAYWWLDLDSWYSKISCRHESTAIHVLRFWSVLQYIPTIRFCTNHPIGSMGLVYLPVFGVIVMVNIGKYTSPMDPIGIGNICETQSSNHLKFQQKRMKTLNFDLAQVSRKNQLSWSLLEDGKAFQFSDLANGCQWLNLDTFCVCLQ